MLKKSEHASSKLQCCYRQGKFAHAAHFTLRCGRQPSNGPYQTPLVALACNFEQSASGTLSYHSATTLFHEFGHALHSLLSRTRYQHLSGQYKALVKLLKLRTTQHCTEFSWIACDTALQQRALRMCNFIDIDLPSIIMYCCTGVTGLYLVAGFRKQHCMTEGHCNAQMVIAACFWFQVHHVTCF